MLHGGRNDLENKTEFGGIIKYDLSVNTVKTPEFIKEALVKMAGVDGTYDYPDRLQESFKNKVAASLSCDPDQVIGGNGASELFCGIVRLLSPKKALLLSPSFYGYDHALKGEKDCEICYFAVSSDNDFDITEEFLNALDESIDMIFIANPNNPTGRIAEEKLLIKILDKCRDLNIYIVVDECFIGFAGRDKSLVRYVDEYPNLFVVDAYTKLFGLAGVRAGYLISRKSNIERLRLVLPEWNMSSFAIKAGEICAEKVLRGEYEKELLTKLQSNKNKAEKVFSELNIDYVESGANFILFRYDGEKNLQEELVKAGILIRDCTGFGGELSKGKYYRVSLSDDEGLDMFLSNLRKIVTGE